MPGQSDLIRRQLVAGAIAVLVIMLVIYGRVAGFDFVWDDSTILWDSGQYRGANVLSAIWANFPISENYFRPFVVSTFALDMLLFSNEPGPMHLHNLLIHISSSLLVGGLVAQCLHRWGKLESALFPVLAALIFGLHPMLIEPAAWISGRFDAYVTFWLLLLLNVDLKLTSLPARMISAFLLFVLAAMSKEMAATFPGIYLLVRMAYLPEQGSLPSRCRALMADGSMAVFAVLILGGVAYLGLRFSALGYVQQPFDETIVSAHFGSALQHLLLVGKTAGTYLLYSIAGGSYISPVHYQVFPLPLDDTGAWAGVVGVSILLLGSLVLILKGNRYGYVLPVFFCGLLPVLNIVFWPNTEDMVQERFMSLPLALMVAVVLPLLAQVEARLSRLVVLVLCCFLLLNAAITAVSMPIWRNHLSLWSWAVHRAPLSPYANTNLAVAFRLNGDHARARYFAEAANRLDPTTRMGDFTLAAIASDEKNFPEAIRIVDAHIAAEGLQPAPLGDLLFIKATALNESGQGDAAAVILQDLLRESSDDHRSAMLLGSILNAQGHTERANACWVQALREMPENEARKKFSDGQLHIESLEAAAGSAHCLPEH